MDDARHARHARLTTLFAQAIELAPAARAELVEQLRADDALLADELAALLAADAGPNAVLRTGGLAPTQAAGPWAGVTVPGRPAVGSRAVISAPQISGYEIEAPLGEGGMGVVYAARQRAPARPVAIKVLHEASALTLGRFWSEAQIMARLDHPGIARVVEAGDAGGHPYIVMERVEGRTLEAYVRETSPPREVRVALMAAVCDAVHHAHVNGVIHRDLKPANMMVRPDGRVVVLDFGIARVADSTERTAHGVLLGTPLYMSPEQASLRADEVDARSDIYSLGVTLYELVAGDLPYAIRDLPLAAVAQVICHDAPKSLRRHGVARDLDAIINKALAKDPRDRYQSAAALGDDLRRFLDGRAVLARTPRWHEQVRRFARRRPLVAGAIVGGAVLVVVFATVVTTLWLEARAAERVAESSRAALAARNAELALEQARLRMAHDPTAALALLEEARRGGVDAVELAVVADEARGRGVAARVLAAHGDEVHWIERLEDGTLLTAGYDGAVRSWSPDAVAGIVVYEAPQGRVHVVRAKGDTLAIGGDAGLLVVTSRDGSLRARLEGHAGDVERLVWVGDTLISADDAGGVLAWSGGRAPGRRLAGPTSQIEALAGVGADDGGAANGVVVGDEAGGVWRWSFVDGRAQHWMIGSAVRAVWAAGDRTAAVDSDGTLYRWHGERAEAPIAARLPVKRAAFARDGAFAVLAGVDGTVVEIGDTVRRRGTHGAKVRGLALDDADRRIATGSEDGIVRVWERDTGRHYTLRGHRQRVRHVVFTGDGLASADGEGTVRLWALDAIPRAFFDVHHAGVERMAVSRDGKRAVSLDSSGVLVAMDLESGASSVLGTATAHVTALAIEGVAVTGDVDGTLTWWRDTPVRRDVGSAVRAIAIAPETGDVAVATAAGAIAWFTATATPRGSSPGHDGGTEAVAFAASGVLVSGGQDRTVRVWNADGSARAARAGPTRDVQLVHAVGEVVAAAGDDGVVRVWPASAEAATPARELTRHRTAVTALAFDAGGRYLASASRDAGITRVDLATGAVIVAPHDEPALLAVAVTPDGRVLVARETGEIAWWSPPAPVAQAKLAIEISAAAALPDGRMLVGTTDGTVRIVAAP